MECDFDESSSFVTFSRYMLQMKPYGVDALMLGDFTAISQSRPLDRMLLEPASRLFAQTPRCNRYATDSQQVLHSTHVRCVRMLSAVRNLKFGVVIQTRFFMKFAPSFSASGCKLAYLRTKPWWPNLQWELFEDSDAEHRVGTCCTMPCSPPGVQCSGRVRFILASRSNYV